MTPCFLQVAITAALITCSSAAIVTLNPFGPSGFTPILTTTGWFGEVTWQLLSGTPLNQDQGSEFLFTFSSGSLNFRRFPSQAPTAQVAGIPGQLTQFALGAPIGPGSEWSSTSSIATPNWDQDSSVSIVGVRANPDEDNSTYYYGWLRIAWNPDTTITFYDWAYESTANQSIAAGAVPEISTTAILAISLIGLARRSR